MLHPPRDPAIEAWVTAQALSILHGRAAQVAETIRQLAAGRPPEPGSEHAKIIRKTLTYLDAKEPYLDYPRALASGWPIATGVIEGACRHLVHDRMGITGARWGLEGAQAILPPRHPRLRRPGHLLGLAHHREPRHDVTSCRGPAGTTAIVAVGGAASYAARSAAGGAAGAVVTGVRGARWTPGPPGARRSSGTVRSDLTV